MVLKPISLRGTRMRSKDDGSGPARCPYEVDLNQPRPKDIPPLLFNYQLHENHQCGTEQTLRQICHRYGYLKPGP